jgi:phosphatidylglycerol lysyltransferase
MAVFPSASAGEPAGRDHQRVLALLRRHGWNATSFQTLEPGFRYWFDGPDACVAFVDTGRSWVAAGAPIAAAPRLGRVAARFVAAARAEGRRAVFFATEARFSRCTRFRTLLVGEQPVWDPREWERTLAASARLREQLSRARRKGLTVRAVAAAELRAAGAPLRRTLERLIERWLAARPMAPMGFLVDVHPFSFVEERRYFVAEQEGRVVGFLAAVPVYARRGWLFEDLVRDPAAPNGAAELLVDAAMRAVAAEGSRYVTLGLAPLGGPIGGWLGVVKRWAASLYDFRGVHAFRAKLRPLRWDPIYASTGTDTRPAALAGSRAIADVLSAFAGGRLVGFGMETLLRGPAFVVRLLGALLVPWTVLLALVGPPVFPSVAVKWAWVAFDVALAASLLALATRWRRWLALGLAVAVTADALVTAIEVLWFNLPRVRGPVEAAALVLATAVPTVASFVLWRAVGHRRRLAHGS